MSRKPFEIFPVSMDAIFNKPGSQHVLLSDANAAIEQDRRYHMERLEYWADVELKLTQTRMELQKELDSWKNGIFNCDKCGTEVYGDHKVAERLKIYAVAFFKYADLGPEYGFKRIHLQTFYTSLEEAKAKVGPNFCDEAGWYGGALIEEKVAGNPYHRAPRTFYEQGEDGLLKEVPEPDWYKNIVNLI